MSSANLYLSLLLTFVIYAANAQRIKYLNGLFENQVCELENGIFGTCRKLYECIEEYENYRKNRTVLKVCSFLGSLQNNLICCSAGHKKFSNRHPFRFKTSKSPQKRSKKSSLIDYEVCRDEFLKYRIESVNPNHYGKAMADNAVVVNQESCDNLSRLNLVSGFNHWDRLYYYCQLKDDGTYEIVKIEDPNSNFTDNVHRPNLVAVGWTQTNKEVIYRCGGTVVTERFIVTAAHCKFHEGKQADTVRLGDRFALIQKLNDRAQQLKIQEFILHPNYNSSLNYNDIALIKTFRRVIFSPLIVPSCIGDLDTERNGFDTEWTISGYREKDGQNASNNLMEMKVYLVSNQDCNKTYEFDSKLPFGIIESQFCVNSNNSDTCFADSGSPLQFKSAHEVHHHDFDTTFTSTVYQTSTVLGIVSFGLRCGIQAPSVYTKLSFYRDWMSSVVEEFN